MKRGRPIKPEEIPKKIKAIPVFVYDGFNELLEAKSTDEVGQTIKIELQEIVKKITELNNGDDSFPRWWLDVEPAYRDAGWKVLYSPKGHLWHKVAQSSKIGSDLNDYFIHRNRLLFGMRHAKIRTPFALYKESLRLLLNGRKWQRQGVIDFYLRRFGKGSWK